MKDKLTVATRGSKLALKQTDMVVSLLQKRFSELEIVKKLIKTKGDKDTRTSLWDLKQTGFFTSCVEDALREGSADFAVHSFKDLPVRHGGDLCIGAVIKREFPEDCLVAKEKFQSAEDIPSGWCVATSSLRRKAQLKNLRSDLKIKSIRGNVPTRVEKVLKGKFDAAVLARAGLERLNMQDHISIVFRPDDFLPASAQGALAVQTRADDADINEIILKINDKETEIITSAERQILNSLQCGCHAPVGAFAELSGDKIIIKAFVSDLEGENLIKKEIEGPKDSARSLAEKLADELLSAGADEILKEAKK